MPDDYPSLSLRLPPETMKALEQDARRRGRTRSAVAKEILQRHFEQHGARKGRLDRLIAMAGTGASHSRFKSGEEVDAWIRHLRGDD